MLREAAPFPHNGATAFVVETGEQVRILRRNADGTALLALAGKRLPRVASDNFTLALDRLRPTLAEAIALPSRGRSAQLRAGARAAQADRGRS